MTPPKHRFFSPCISLLLLTVVLPIAPTTVPAATRIVKQDGSAAYTTIQSALDACANGDIVEVQDDGVYAENLNFPSRSNLTLRAGTGYSPTITCGGDPGRNNYINVQSAGSRISGFHITFSANETTDCNFILGGTSATVDNCVLIGPETTTTTLRGVVNIKTLTNVEVRGFRLGALYDLNGLVATVTDCNLHDNETQLEVSLPQVLLVGCTLKSSAESCNARLTNTGSISFDNCLFEGATQENIVVQAGSLFLNRSILLPPGSAYPSVHVVDSAKGACSATVDHCDFVSGSGQPSVVGEGAAASAYVTNSILTGALGIAARTGAAATSDYNDVYCTGTAYEGLTAGSHDLAVDPMYIQTTDSTQADFFRLQPYSPCSTADSSGLPLGSRGIQGIAQTITVGVYYYPWYTTNFHGAKYMRKHLVPAQAPELGEYSDRDSSVLAQHLAWSKYAGINLWVCSWWGPGDNTDITLRDYILTRSDLGDVKFAIHYETSGRTSGFSNYSNIGPDLTYIADTYFSHPNYYKINGKPVVVVYLTRVLSSNGTLQSTIQTMRDAAQNQGYQIYILGDQAFSGNPSGAASTDVQYLDGITNYDVYGSMGATLYAGQTRINTYFTNQDKWAVVASGYGKAYVPGISPGFNDRGVRDGHTPLSRRITSSDPEGSVFQEMVRQGKLRVDTAAGNLILVNSFNEWHEDTEIEPVAPAPDTNVDDCVTTPDYYTNGLNYSGFGTLYLDILRNSLPKSLSVDSDYGSPSPSGTTSYDSGTIIAASVEPVVDEGAGVHRVCIGWLGSGSAPTSGTTNSVEFTLNENSALHWLWKTQYALTVASDHGNPTPAPGDNYIDAGSQVTAQVEASVPGSGSTTYVCTGWTGLGSVPIAGSSNSVAFQLDQPSSITWTWESNPSAVTGWQLY